MAKKLVVFTGASGSGKTTIARACAEKYADTLSVYHFDDIEIPAEREMIRQYGSIEEWQRNKTREWIRRLALASDQTVLFEAQSRISFLLEAILAELIYDFRIVLVDCSDEERERRLIHDRDQTDLATQNLRQWAEFLRQEARRHNCEILDTTSRSISDSVEQIRDYLV